MNPPPAQPADTGHPADPLGPTDQILDRLETLLAGQGRLARSGRLDGLPAAAQETGQLVEALRRSARSLSAEQAQRASRLLDRHRRIGLALAQRKDELARRLGHLARAKKTLSAYRGRLA